MLNKILLLDCFSDPIRLKFNGKEKIGTIPSTILRFCLYVLLLAYEIEKDPN